MHAQCTEHTVCVCVCVHVRELTVLARVETHSLTSPCPFDVSPSSAFLEQHEHTVETHTHIYTMLPAKLSVHLALKG